MSKTQESNGLGPLPEADSNAELERRSIDSFRATLPADRFRFRDERVEDAGVDGSLELLIASRYTNLRSQVQLKSTASAKAKRDGSISLQVKVSNLNYLLNGPSPLYILYNASNNELLFAWARDERKRLDQVNPEWIKQETVTLRFVERVTPKTLNEIYERIRREGQLHRRINDILSRASASEHVITSIDTNTLETTDPKEIYQLLLTSGATMVSAGYGLEVKKLLHLLNPTDAQVPRLQLIRAYAEYATGRYQGAMANLAEVTLRSDELSRDDQQLLSYLRNACDYQTGCINLEEYTRRLEAEIEQHGGGINASYNLSSIRYELFAEMDPVRRVELINKMRSTVGEISAATNITDEFKLHARLILLETEGTQSFLESTAELHQKKLSEALGRAFDVQEALRSQRDRWSHWERAVDDALRDAVATNNPLIIGDALAIRATIRVAHLAIYRLLRPMFGIHITLTEEILIPPKNDAEQAVRIYAKAGQFEGELRARILLADIFMLAGKEDDARDIAQDILPKAQAMNYAGLQERAQDIISGKTLWSVREAAVAEAEKKDMDFPLAEYGPKVLHKAARDSLKALDLPSNRLSVVEREFQSMQDIARERLRWCRHIDLVQDLRHTEHQSTYYLTDPERRCICLMHKYESAIGSADWKALVTAFKQAYCNGCPDRDPKVKAP